MARRCAGAAFAGPAPKPGMNDRSVAALSAEDVPKIEPAAGTMLRHLDYLQRPDCEG
jgi:hypothetical protein